MAFLWKYLFDTEAGQYQDRLLTNKTVIACTDILKSAHRDIVC
jgi:hypothetical protein